MVPSFDVVQDPLSFLGCQSTLWAHAQLSIPENIQVLQCKAGPNQLFLQSVLMSGIAFTQVQHLALRLVELHEVLLHLILELVQVPLDVFSSFCCFNCTSHPGLICKTDEDTPLF